MISQYVTLQGVVSSLLVHRHACPVVARTRMPSTSRAIRAEFTVRAQRKGEFLDHVRTDKMLIKINCEPTALIDTELRVDS